VRTGPPIDDEADYALPIWAGVVPVRMVAVEATVSGLCANAWSEVRLLRESFAAAGVELLARLELIVMRMILGFAAKARFGRKIKSKSRRTWNHQSMEVSLNRVGWVGNGALPCCACLG